MDIVNMDRIEFEPVKKVLDLNFMEKKYS